MRAEQNLDTSIWGAVLVETSRESSHKQKRDFSQAEKDFSQVEKRVLTSRKKELLVEISRQHGYE